MRKIFQMMIIKDKSLNNSNKDQDIKNDPLNLSTWTLKRSQIH